MGVALDLRDPAAPAQAIAQAVEHFGRLDLLVNNAGVTKWADFFSLTEEHWQDGFALRFHGHVRMTRAAWPRVRESNVGVVHIVGVGSRSESAEFTIGGSVSVALMNFTKAMTDISTEHRARGSGQRGQSEADRDRPFHSQCRAGDARSRSCPRRGFTVPGCFAWHCPGWQTGGNGSLLAFWRPPSRYRRRGDAVFLARDADR
ncbi:SDR family NAD(P)-dependent oxidoreductase [Rhodopila sp.]|uniref:SDR family NAD(P)-dependent oxidoreductase n=1 Tax=Rhodopila sp. TaxID=2480087 RepID=UPI003D10DA46